MSYCKFLNLLNLTNKSSISIPTLQSLSTITQESANDERVEEDPETIHYLNKSPCKDGYYLRCNYKSNLCTKMFNGLLYIYIPVYLYVQLRTETCLCTIQTLVYYRSVVINTSLVDMSSILPTLLGDE